MNIYSSIAFIESTKNDTKKLTKLQSEQLELLSNNKLTVSSYYKIANNYKYWSNERLNNELKESINTIK